MIARRSFFKTILGAIAGVALAQKIALEAVCARAPEPEELKINPAYANAEYEVLFFTHPWPEGLGETKVEIAVDVTERWTFSDGEFKKSP